MDGQDWGGSGIAAPLAHCFAGPRLAFGNAFLSPPLASLNYSVIIASIVRWYLADTGLRDYTANQEQLRRFIKRSTGQDSDDGLPVPNICDGFVQD